MSDASWFSDAAKSPYLPIVTGIVRGLVAIASGFGFTWALTVSGSQIQMAATAAIALAMLLWSAYQKVAAVRAARRAEVAAAVNSIRIGVPVTVIETPQGQPNVAERIPPAEIIVAPTVPITVEKAG